MRNGACNLDDICVAGITPFTTIDFPGRLAGVFYLQGCAWRCRYCYNSEFWPLPPYGTHIPVEKIRHYLTSRKGHLDGIVFSGGEPTVHLQLSAWIKAVKDMGYEIGLHTGGIFPDRLSGVLPLCDWVGMDIKVPFSLYEKVTRIPASGDAARQSASLVLASNKPYEFRTTIHPDLLTEMEILEMARELAGMGCKNFTLQSFRGEHCHDKELRESYAQTPIISAGLRSTLQSLFASFQIRE
ncbi:MAG TPA: anaerobic ribonucleoside-triphosphate reductase activating protein [Candidatus Omnitrophota bacterium]|nr:anaerobic ribonucleoside-triphosphate reductase activating protein [Candidatus Omnitrophota bacterium]